MGELVKDAKDPRKLGLFFFFVIEFNRIHSPKGLGKVKGL